MKFVEFTHEARMGHVDAIHLHSNEGDIYTAEAVIKGRPYLLESKQEKGPWVFHSFREAKQAFEDYPEVPISLEQRDVYDEMVGEHDKL